MRLKAELRNDRPGDEQTPTVPHDRCQQATEWAELRGRSRGRHNIFQRWDPQQGVTDRPAGDLYCRTPQDSIWNVRGARNYPCITRPGKRAPTVKMCESDEVYVPLNEGWNWKGDPNATLSGQDIPQLPPGSPPAAAAHAGHASWLPRRRF